MDHHIQNLENVSRDMNLQNKNPGHSGQPDDQLVPGQHPHPQCQFYAGNNLIGPSKYMQGYPIYAGNNVIGFNLNIYKAIHTSGCTLFVSEGRNWRVFR